MNVLLIHTHDTGKFLSPYGYKVPSEKLEEFSGDALVFRNAYCASPTCSPSRACLMTGMYAHNNGMLALSQRGTDITNLKGHLANYLKENNYHTVLCGVQHERKFWRPLSLAKEASEDLGYLENISSDFSDIQNDTDLLQWDIRNSQRVIDFLEQNPKDRPFFLSYGMHATHREYPRLDAADLEIINPDHIQLPPNAYDNEDNRYDTACLHKSIRSFDTCFQNVIDALKHNGLYDDTIIIYTTDHGLANPFAKCGLTDQGIGIALIIRAPGHPVSYGAVTDSLVSNVDIFPTLCQLLGLPVPSNIQGKSFKKLFTDLKYELQDCIYAEVNFHTSYEPQRCIRTKRYKYIKYYDESWTKYNLSNMDESCVKDLLMETGMAEKQKPMEALYDLYYDSGEKDNLADNPEYTNILKELKEKLEEWRLKTKDKILSLEEYNGKIKVNKKSSKVASPMSPMEYESIVN